MATPERNNEDLTLSLPIKCTHGDGKCSRTCLKIVETEKGLALSITHKHDGEWHTSKIKLELIEKVLREKAA